MGQARMRARNESGGRLKTSGPLRHTEGPATVASFRTWRVSRGSVAQSPKSRRRASRNSHVRHAITHLWGAQENRHKAKRQRHGGAGGESIGDRAAYQRGMRKRALVPPQASHSRAKLELAEIQ